MIPLRDSTRSLSFPVITVAIILINLLLFYNISQLSDDEANQLFYLFGLVPGYYFKYQTIPLDYLPFVSSMFLHGSWMHVISNMWILWLFGDNVEDHMGKIKFLIFYLICGIIAALVHFFIYPSSDVPVVGASGAVAGIMGAYFIMFRNAKVLTLVPPFFLVNIPAWVYLGFWFITQFWGGAADLFISTSSEQIAFWAHVGGFAAGVFLYRFFLNPRFPNPRYNE